jgi:hypothetical protein
MQAGDGHQLTLVEAHQGGVDHIFRGLVFATVFWAEFPAMSQNSVAVAPGRTVWTRIPLSARSCCTEWPKLMTNDFDAL